MEKSKGRADSGGGGGGGSSNNGEENEEREEDREERERRETMAGVVGASNGKGPVRVICLYSTSYILIDNRNETYYSKKGGVLHAVTLLSAAEFLGNFAFILNLDIIPHFLNGYFTD